MGIKITFKSPRNKLKKDRGCQNKCISRYDAHAHKKQRVS